MNLARRVPSSSPFASGKSERTALMSWISPVHYWAISSRDPWRPPAEYPSPFLSFGGQQRFRWLASMYHSIHPCYDRA